MEKEQEEMIQEQTDATAPADMPDGSIGQKVAAFDDRQVTEEENGQPEELETGADDTAEETDDRDPITVAKENFYDRLPFTYRQVDIFCKVLIGVLIAIFVYYAVLK